MHQVCYTLSSRHQEAQPASPPPPATSSASGKEIYIGHVKDDYAGKRTGTKGRFVVDDPKKYPGREADNLSGEDALRHPCACLPSR